MMSCSTMKLIVVWAFEDIEALRTLPITGIKQHQVVDAFWWNEFVDTLTQIAVWINQAASLARLHLGQKHVLKQRRLSRAAAADDVGMTEPIPHSQQCRVRFAA